MIVLDAFYDDCVNVLASSWLARRKIVIYFVVFSFANCQYINHHYIIFYGIYQTIAYSV